MNGQTIKLPFLLAMLAAVLGGCMGAHPDGPIAGGPADGGGDPYLASHNNWRGGVVGASFGDIPGVTLGEISSQGVQQAVDAKKPVEYWTENGRGFYRAEPLEYNAYTRCRKVREQVYEGGALISDRVKELCAPIRDDFPDEYSDQ